MQPGSLGMGMEGRKAAPALRARFLRSYVPLRRVRAGARPPAPYPDSPAAPFPLHNSEFHIYKSSPGCGMIVIVYGQGKAFQGVCFIPVRGAVFL